jgi:rubrerythrin
MMSRSKENLKNAFAGEAQANRRYLAFARRAEEEGLPQEARLFRATAEAETIHALNHIRILGEVKSTAENLNAAVVERLTSTQNVPRVFSNCQTREKATSNICLTKHYVRWQQLSALPQWEKN